MLGFEKDIETYLSIPESDRNSTLRKGPDDEEVSLPELPVCLQGKTKEEVKDIYKNKIASILKDSVQLISFSSQVAESDKDLFNKGEKEVKEKFDPKKNTALQEIISVPDYEKMKGDVCGALLEMMIYIENSNDQPSEITFDNKIKYVIYFTPAGKPIILPVNAKPDFTTSTKLKVPEGALVGFTLNEKYYAAHYRSTNGKIIFEGYVSTGNNGTTIRYYDTIMYKLVQQVQSDVPKVELATFAIPVVIGNGSSGGIGIALEELIGGSAIRTGLIRGTGLAAVGYLIINLFSSPPNPALYTGEGVIVMALPYEANLAPLPVGIPVTIPHQLPKESGNCHVYVIWQITTDGSIEVAKYGMTCQGDYDDNSTCSPRPDKQVTQFNRNPDPGIVSYSYSWVKRDVSKVVAHIIEKSLTAGYLILYNIGELPPKQLLPCFVKGESDIFLKRIDLARKYLDEMIKQYGK